MAEKKLKEEIKEIKKLIKLYKREVEADADLLFQPRFEFLLERIPVLERQLETLEAKYKKEI